MKKYILLVLTLVWIVPKSQGQTILTLEKCLEIAFQGNLDLRQLQISLANDALSLRQTKLDYLPSLSMSNSVTRSGGTTFDFNTFRRITQNTQSASHSINASMDVFNGFQNYYTLKQAESNMQETQYGIEKSKNTLITNITQAFFQIIYDQENLKVSKERQDLIALQLERVKKQFDAGAKTEIDVLSLESQLATENLNRINQDNLLLRDKLTLLQLVNLDFSGEYIFQAPDIGSNVLENAIPNLDEVITLAMGTQPSIKEKEANLKGMQYGMKATRALLYPNLSLSGGVRTSYSSNGVPDFSQPSGLRKDPYTTQLKDNVSNQVSVNLNIPVFNNYRAATNVQKSQLQVKNAELDFQKQRNALVREVQAAHLEAGAAAAKYEATKVQVQSLGESFNFAKSRYENGLLDFYAFREILNSKTNAETQLLNASFDYLLKIKVLDLYQGKALSF